MCKIILDIIVGCDFCLLVVCGFCFIYDLEIVLEYVCWFKVFVVEVSDSFYLVMCVYFEKFCIIVGWKGLINDFYMDGFFDVEVGL